jgi:hypothetical protein
VGFSNDHAAANAAQQAATDLLPNEALITGQEAPVQITEGDGAVIVDGGCWPSLPRRKMQSTSVHEALAQPVDATQAPNRSAGVANAKVLRSRSFS